MNPIAEKLNVTIERANPEIYGMLSAIGKKLFFPKGILSQSAEAKQKAHKLNATIGIATQKDGIMCFPSVMENIDGIPANESLTYAPSYGIPALRKTWKEAQQKKNPSLFQIPTSLPVVTSGITHALSLVGDVWVDPGDVIVLPDMMWGNYNMIFGVRKDARISTYNIFDEKGGFDLGSFESKLKEEAQTKGKLIVLLNFPQNPSGYSATESEAEKLAEILIRMAENGTDVIAVMDDSYFGLFYEENVMKESLFTKLAGKHKKLLAIKLDGATKENFVWGLRVGFITYGCQAGEGLNDLYTALEQKTAGCLRGNISSSSHLGQSIVLKSMTSDSFVSESREKFDVLKSRAEKVKEVLKKPKYQDAWDVYPFNSGYFMCIKLKHVNAEKLRVHLLDNHGVGLISIGEKNLRVAFSCLEYDEVEELFDTVYKGIGELTE